VEGVGSPRVACTRPRPQVEFEKWKKLLFFWVKLGFSLLNWPFQQSFMGFDSIPA
jgi:hypothetical protein